jgi:hypothetical protein
VRSTTSGIATAHDHLVAGVDRNIWPLRGEADSLRTFCDLVRLGWLRLPGIGLEMLDWYRAFLERYASVAPDLADATLVYLAERLHINTVFTLDRRDFSIYRIGKNRAFRLLPERL